MSMIVVGVLLFSFLSWEHLLNDVKKSRWTVYRVQGHTAMEWSEKGHSYFIGDSAIIVDRNNIKFHLLSNRLVNGAMDIDAQTNFNQGTLQIYHRDGKTFLWLYRKLSKLPTKLSIDYLIVSNNSLMSLKMLEEKISFKHLILDSSNSIRYSEKIEKEAVSMKKNVTLF